MSRPGLAFLLTAVLASSAACKSSPESTPPVVTSVAPTPTPTASAVKRDGAHCQQTGDCPTGQTCMFEDSGCDAVGVCRVTGGLLNRECYMAIPMCSCSRKKTFYGAGGCAGNSVNERWELYGCPCASNADCKGGQICGRGTPRPRDGGIPNECQDPKAK